MKKTETWQLVFNNSYATRQYMQLDPTTTIFSSGKKETLLSDGKSIFRTPLPSDVVMLIPLLGEVYKADQTAWDKAVKRYPAQSFVTAAPDMKESDFSANEWTLYTKNKAVVDFMKRHAQVSVVDTNGQQSNSNFLPTQKAFFILTNLDSVEREKAQWEIKYSRVMNEVIQIKENADEFKNLAYLMGINPEGLSESELFNIMKDILSSKAVDSEKNEFKIDWLDRLLNDSDKWYKIVIQKALTTERSAGGEKYITDDGYKNYSMNGTLIANNMVSLIGYLKDHKDLFDGLQDSLGMKKKELSQDQPVSTESDMEEKRKPGRPAAK